MRNKIAKGRVGENIRVYLFYIFFFFVLPVVNLSVWSIHLCRLDKYN